MSVTNSLYDPLGLAAPVIIKGKHLLRSLSKEFSASHPDAWDYPLPAEREAEWKEWCHSLRALEDIKVPRSYGTEALKCSARIELQASVMPPRWQSAQYHTYELSTTPAKFK